MLLAGAVTSGSTPRVSFLIVLTLNSDCIRLSHLGYSYIWNHADDGPPRVFPPHTTFALGGVHGQIL